MQPGATGEVTIPADRIERELLKSARPGFYGQTEIEIVVEEKALEGVSFRVKHQSKLRAGDTSEQVSAAAQDTEREGMVKRQMRDVKRLLRLRVQTVKIIGHFQDGRLQNFEIVDQPA